MAQPASWFWTRQQRIVLAILVLLLTGVFAVRALQNPAHVSDPPGPGEFASQFPGRIDPNTADWPAWAALPLIGEKRAKEIVAFREKWLSENPGQTAFEKLEDLTRVKGIGKETIKTLEPYLVFPNIQREEN